MQNYYNWEEILSEFTDSELYKTIYDRGAPQEKKAIAERMLVDNGLIIKDEKGIYRREIIAPFHLEYMVNLLKFKTKEETVAELHNNGLNKASAHRLICHYEAWKVKQTKKGKIWKIILPIGIAAWVLISVVFSSPLGAYFMIFPLLFFVKYSTSTFNYKRIKIFKVISEEAYAAKLVAAQQ